MPIQVHYDLEGRGARLHAFGHTTGLSLMEAIEGVLSPDPLAEPAWLLFDFSDVERFDVSADEARRCASRVREAGADQRSLVLAVVAPTDVVFGTARLCQAHLDGSAVEMEVFREGPPAVAWGAKRVAALRERHSGSGGSE